MLNLLNRQKTELAGLDIGSSTVKLVRLNKSDDGYSLIAAACESITPCQDDQTQWRQNSVDAIKTCMRKAGFKDGNVVCGISGPEVVVRSFKFPPLPEQAIPQAVRMEVQQVCPLDIDHSILDFQLVETSQTESTARQGVMAVGTEKVVHEQMDLLTQAGAKPVMVDVNALALLNCLNEINAANPKETVAVVDIGNLQTNVVIYGIDGLPFVRDINIAGLNVIREISNQTELSEDQIRQKLMQKQQTQSWDGNILLALNNAIRPLVNGINETLRFYSFQEKTAGVDRIFLCGGFALIDAFVELLADAVSIPVDLLNPFSVIQHDLDVSQNKILEKDGPVFAVATGLAMRTV